MERPLPNRIEWGAHEHIHQEKTPDWYYGLGLVVLVCIIASTLFGNILLGLIFFFGGIALALYAAKHPHYADFGLTHRGIFVEDRLYAYESFSSFWIDDMDRNQPPKLILKSKRLTVPLLVIPLVDVDEEEVHRYLARYLKEVESAEPLSHKLFEAIGF